MNVYLFYLLVVVVVYARIAFLQQLIKLGAVPWLIDRYPGYRFAPSAHWLSFKKGRPRIDRQRVKYFSRLEKRGYFIQYRLSVVGLVFLQLLNYLGLCLWVALVAVPIIFIVTIGFILNELKVFPVKRIYNQYMYLLVGHHRFDKTSTSGSIDEKHFEELVEEKFFSKTIPLLAVQSINTLLVEVPDFASLIGMSWSLYVVANTLWKWVYYALLLSVNYKFAVKSHRNLKIMTRKEREAYLHTQKVVQFTYLEKHDIHYTKLCEAWKELQNTNKITFLASLDVYEPLDLLKLDAQTLYLIARSAADASGSLDSKVFYIVAFNILMSQMSKALREKAKVKLLKNLEKFVLYRVYVKIANSEFIYNLTTDQLYLLKLVLDYISYFVKLLLGRLSSQVVPISAIAAVAGKAHTVTTAGEGEAAVNNSLDTVTSNVGLAHGS